MGTQPPHFRPMPIVAKRSPISAIAELLLGKGNTRACPTTLCHELCKNGWTDQDAIWIVDSGGPKEACIRWDAHWRHLANTTELFMFGGDVALCQITMTTCSFMIYCINECFCPVFDFNLTVCGFLFNNYNKCSFLIISRSWIAGRILTCAKLFQSVSNGLLCQVIIVLFGKNMPLVLVT